MHRICQANDTQAFLVKPIEFFQKRSTRAAQLDVIQAKVRFAQLVSGIAPVLNRWTPGWTCYAV